MNTFFSQNFSDLPSQFSASYLWNQENDFIFWEELSEVDFNPQKKWPTRKSWLAGMDYSLLSDHLLALQTFFEKKTPLVSQFSLSLPSQPTFHVKETLRYLENSKKSDILGQVIFHIERFNYSPHTSVLPQPDIYLNQALSFLAEMHQPVGLHLFIIEPLSAERENLQSLLNHCLGPFLRYQEQAIPISHDGFLLVQYNPTYSLFEKLKAQIKETFGCKIFDIPLLIEHECIWLTSEPPS